MTLRPGQISGGRAARRQFLKWGLVGSLGLLMTDPVQALAGAGKSPPVTLSLYHVRTREALCIPHCPPGAYDAATLADFDRLMRDRRTGEVKHIDSRLLDYLFAVQSILGAPGPFHIFSGYRTLETNAWLRRTGRGAAPNSYHLKGQAVDLWIPGIRIDALKQAALKARAGGVGYYPDRHFVHLDVGPVRHWSA